MLPQEPRGDREMRENEPPQVNEWLRKATKRRTRLDSLTPLQREEVARWIESKFERLEERIAQAEWMTERGQGPEHLANQLAFWRACRAISKQLAWYARTEKGGPMHLDTIQAQEQG